MCQYWETSGGGRIRGPFRLRKLRNANLLAFASAVGDRQSTSVRDASSPRSMAR